MYQCFNVELDNPDAEKLLSNVSEPTLMTLKARSGLLQKSIRELYIPETNTIDAAGLKKLWFPSGDSANHVFISHSHKDIDMARKLAAWLKEKFNITSFIDYDVWGYAQDLIREINDLYSSIPNNMYDYDKANYVCSHIHMMLSSALTDMIYKCEALFFLNTQNSLKDHDRTTSPWIMHELLTTKVIERYQCIKRKSIAREHFRDQFIEKRAMDLMPDFSHHAEVKHLLDINIDTLLQWQKSSDLNYNGYYNLTSLYNLLNGDTTLYHEDKAELYV